MRLRRRARGGATMAFAAILCWTLASCDDDIKPRTGPRPNSTATPYGAAPSTSAHAGVGGCGRVFPPGAKLPSWTESARPPTDIPWIMSASGNIVGVLFGQPLLAAPRHDGRNNKILWISMPPRNGQPLDVTGTRVSDKKIAKSTEPAGSSPGEIYPTIIDMPGPGCWRLDLKWGPNAASVYLYYGA